MWQLGHGELPHAVSDIGDIAEIHCIDARYSRE